MISIDRNVIPRISRFGKSLKQNWRLRKIMLKAMKH